MSDYISKITTYGVPWEEKSEDRVIANIETILDTFKLDEFDESSNMFSFEINNTTSGTVSINSIKRANYLKIESEIFANTPITYWFINTISNVVSETGTEYEINLDVIATFGQSMLTGLENKPIHIKRIHEDRYTLNTNKTQFDLSTKYHPLINSDFKFGDTKGSKLIYGGGGVKVETLNITDFDDNLTDEETISPMRINGRYSGKDPNNNGTLEYSPSDVWINFDNTLSIGDKKFYIYALVNITGDPPIIDTTITLEDKTFLSEVHNDYDDRTKALRHSVLVPINTINYDHTGNSFHVFNTLDDIAKLQKDKVLNVIKSPYKLEGTNRGGNQLVFKDDGTRLIRHSFTHTNWFYQANPKQLSVATLNTLSFHPDNNETNVNEIYFFRVINTIKNSFTINTSDMGQKEIFESILFFGNPTEMKNIVDNEPEKLEIGILNSDIMPTTMFFGDTSSVLDYYNFYTMPEQDWIDGDFSHNEMGIESTLRISGEQYAQWNDNSLMSFWTLQGSSYLANNKYSIQAQKIGVDWQKEMDLRNNKMNTASTFGGGVVSAGLSLLNPVSYITAGFSGAQYGTIANIAENKKVQINASIADAYATSPTFNSGKEHNLIDFNKIEFKHKFNWLTVKPNEYILRKIITFYDHHGGNVDDWLVLTSDIYNSRSRFNYMAINDIRDYLDINTFPDMNIDIIEKFNYEFNKGIRIWHVNEIGDYSKPNIENIIKDNLPT